MFPLMQRFAYAGPSSYQKHFTNISPKEHSHPRLLVFGGSGTLGSHVVAIFKRAGWFTTSVDYEENPDAHINIIIDRSRSWVENTKLADTKLSELGQKYGTLVSTAGAWVGGTVGEDSFLTNASRMLDSNLSSAFGACHLAKRHLNCDGSGGLLVLTGAWAATQATPDMLAFGSSKAAVHHLVRSLAQGGLPDNVTVTGVLPMTIDTPENRRLMPDANFSTWTLPDVFASRILEWADRRIPPVNGGLHVFRTENHQTTVIRVP